MNALIMMFSSPRWEQFWAWSGVAFGVLLLTYWLLYYYRQRQRIAAIAKQSHTTEKVKSAWFDFLLTPLSGVLFTSKSDMDERFVNAGFIHFRYAHLYMPIKYLLLISGEAVIAIFAWLGVLGSQYWLAIASVWAMVIIVVPDAVLASRAKGRQRRITGQIPYLIDLMAICVQTGMTIEASMKYLAVEMLSFDKEMAALLDMTNKRARIVGMERALEELNGKVPSTEMNSFVMTLSQSMQHGSSMYEVLTTLSADIREVQMLDLVEQIGKLAAKMSIPLIVFILMPIVFVIAAPGVMRMMLHV